jgi:hypothetical protein
MVYSKELNQAVSAAKGAIGVGNRYERITDLAGFLTGNGVEFKIIPTKVEGKVVHRGNNFFFFRTTDRIEMVSVPAEEIEITGVGRIPPAMQVCGAYSDHLVDGKIVVSFGGGIYPQEDNNRPSRTTKEVEEFLLGLFPKFTLSLPEEVVSLPIPSWLAVVGDTDSAYAGIEACVVFRSEAENLWAEFVAQNPFGPPAGYKVVDLSTRKVRLVATEQEAVGEALGMAGLVVVDSAGGRVYDGEYQIWRTMSEYLAAFPAVAWIAEL